MKLKKIFLYIFFSLFFIFFFGIKISRALEVDYPTIPFFGWDVPILPSNPTHRAVRDQFLEYARYLYGLGVVIAGTITLLFVVLGGFRYLISLGRGEMRKKGLDWIKSGFLGLALVMSTYLIVYTINPDLRHFYLPLLGDFLVEEYDPEIDPRDPGTIVYEEIPAGKVVEKSLTPTTDCYNFSFNADPLFGEIEESPDYNLPTHLDHDKIYCLEYLVEAAERKSEILKDLSEEIAKLMETCDCKEPDQEGASDILGSDYYSQSTCYQKENQSSVLGTKNTINGFQNNYFNPLIGEIILTGGVGRTDEFEKPEGELLEATNISAESATLRGRVIDTGNAEEYYYIFKWREKGRSSWNQTDQRERSENLKNFSETIEVTPNKNYEFTAVIMNDEYSTSELTPYKTFSTPPLAEPEIRFVSVTEYEERARLTGKVINMGGHDRINYEFRWKEFEAPSWSSAGGSVSHPTSFSENALRLTPGTGYEFQLKARGNLIYEGEFMTEYEEYEDPTNPEGELEGVRFISDDRARVRFDITDVGHCVVEYRAGWKKTSEDWQEGDWTGNVRWPRSGINHTITNLEEDTEYRIKVEIKNSTGNIINIGYDNFRTEKTREIEVTPPEGNIRNIISSLTDEARLMGEITDTGNANEINYEFRWKKVGEEVWDKIRGTKSFPARRYVNETAENLTPGREYEVEFEVSNEVGFHISFDTFTTHPITEDHYCEYYPLQDIMATSFLLTGRVTRDDGERWQYQFSYKTEGAEEWIHTDWRGNLRAPQPFSKHATNLSPNTDYRFNARIRNKDNEEEIKDCVFREVPPPVGLNAESLNNTQAFVSWKHGLDVDNIIVRREKDRCPTSVSDGENVYEGPENSFVDTGLVPESEYCYRAWAQIGSVYSDPSNSAWLLNLEKIAACEEDWDCIGEEGCRFYRTESSPGVYTKEECELDCGCVCPLEEPACDVCPPGIRDIVEEGDICLDGKIYKGLEEYRTEHENDEELINYIEKDICYLKNEKEVLQSSDNFSEGEIKSCETNGGKVIKIIIEERWKELSLIDQLKYLKEKIKNFDHDTKERLDLLRKVKKSLADECYPIRNYPEVVKSIREEDKKEVEIKRSILDPETNEPVKVSKYCMGYQYANSNYFHTCRNLCPGTLEKDYIIYENCLEYDELAGACISNHFSNSYCKEESDFLNFEDCVLSNRNKCIEECEGSIDLECNDNDNDDSLYPECLEKCNTDSEQFLKFEEDRVFFNSRKQNDCYLDIFALTKCAERTKEAFGGCFESRLFLGSGTTYCPPFAIEFFQNCAEETFKCKYASDQHAGYMDLIDADKGIPEPDLITESISSNWIYKNLDRHLLPPTNNPLIFNDYVKYIPEEETEERPLLCSRYDYGRTCKGPLYSPCPSCAFSYEDDEDPLKIDEAALLTGPECDNFLYNDDPLTFYCREEWEETLRVAEPLGREWITGKNQEIPLGETIDETEKWLKNLTDNTTNLVEELESMIKYVLSIGEEEDYCECDSLCNEPGEKEDWACEPPCEFNEKEILYTDPDTGQETSYWVYWCTLRECEGNPCQKMINMLMGGDDCGEFDGVGVFHHAVTEEAKNFKNEGIHKARSELLKKLIYSRKIMEQGSRLAIEREEVEIMNCQEVINHRIYPITHLESEFILRGLDEESRREVCYGREAGKKIGEFLTDNWFIIRKPQI